MLIKKIKENLQDLDGQEVVLQGWVRTNRKSKNLGFIELNDGSSFNGMQVVYFPEMDDYEEVKKITTGSAI